MFEQFTDRARKVMALANQEAQRLNHEYIGTEHLLLGLLREGEGVAAQVLINLGLDINETQTEVLNLLGAGVETEDVKLSPEIYVTAPVSSSAEDALVKEIEELDQLKDANVRNANYQAAAHIRDMAEEKRKELDKIQQKCKCGAKATVYTQQQDGKVQSKNYFCEKCAKNKAKWEALNINYTETSDLTPKQLIELAAEGNISKNGWSVTTTIEDTSQQSLLKALANVESSLFEVLSSLTDPELMNDKTLDSVVEVVNYIKSFTVFRDKLLS